MTNKEWLDYLAQNAPDELAAWFDAERTEPPTSATMQRIGQVIEDTVKRGVYGDKEPENEDSREQLEADIRDTVPEWHVDTIIGWLDRQAEITRHELSPDAIDHMLNTIGEQEERIAELTAELENWKANCEDWKKHARAAENACYETMLEREDYRKKFGKCLDYADAIHALMDDEGMA